MAVRDGVRRTGLNAIAAEYAAVVIDVIDLGVPLAATDPDLVGVLSRFNVDAIRRAGRRAKKAGHALLEPILIPLQHVDATVTLLELRRLVGIILGHRGRHHLLQSDAHAL